MYNQFYLNCRKPLVMAYLNSIYPIILKHRAKRIGKKDKIEVVFFAMNLAMWRYQGVYELLSKEKRFNCHIVLTGARQFSAEQRHRSLEVLRNYFKSKDIDFIDFDEDKDEGCDVKGLINPDILFYPQPYENQYIESHCFRRFYGKLICYIPYGLTGVAVNKSRWVFDTVFQNLAWKLYYPFEHNKLEAQDIAKNHARNVVVSGYPNLDSYLNNERVDVWKIKDRSLKRLIWAPHFSVPSKDNWITRSNFLWMCDLMLKVAKRYSDRLQIAFKPHPWLKSTLYQYPEWGKTKTDQYFEQWNSLSNTFIASEFVNLFKTSDAMIHDSASFTVEYLFVNKPVAFVALDLEKLMVEYPDFGRAALNQHYIVGNEDEVMAFIEDVVLEGKDTMSAQRTAFFENVLRPKTSGSTSQFIVDDIKQSLGIQ